MDLSADGIGMLFKRKKEDDGGRKQKGRFMAGVYDEVTGGHFDGGDIVLWDGIGGGRFPAEDIGDSMPETEPGSFRLVLQDFAVTGALRGSPAVTTEPVPEDVALTILSKTGLTGNLSVWTPRREDALEAVRRATGEDALEYCACTGYLGREFRNLRSRAPLRNGEGLAGPMCLYGEPLAEDGSDEARYRLMDFSCGFHADGEAMVLSSDLGSGRLSMQDIDAGITEVPDGEYRAVVLTDPLMKIVEKAGTEVPEHIRRSAAMSAEPVSRQVALRICQNFTRAGALCVYTLRREDAWDLVAESSAKAKPYEAEVPEGIAGHVEGAIGTKGAGRESVMVFYGVGQKYR